MANYPKKMTDPTEAALSAIQEALNIQDEEQASRPEGMADLFAGSPDSRQQGAAATQPGQDPYASDAIGTRDLSGSGARAANDDQQSIGKILHALQQRPARSSY